VRVGLALRLAFTIPGNPVAKGRPKFRRFAKFVTTYTPKKTETYEDIVRHHALEAWDGKPLLDGVALQLDVQCFIGVPKSWSKKKRAAALNGGGIRPLGRPDWDNFGKLVSDALNGVIYRDDSAIWDARVTKQYSDVARTEISITWTDPDPEKEGRALATEFGLTANLYEEEAR
jgi:Holliday junction resolvase RusA-like endonuclease